MCFTILKITFEKNSFLIILRTRTLHEIEDEEEKEQKKLEEKSVSSGDGNEDDGPIYNPKNLPLGWDGKPIRIILIQLIGSINCMGQELSLNAKYAEIIGYFFMLVIGEGDHMNDILPNGVIHMV